MADDQPTPSTSEEPKTEKKDPSQRESGYITSTVSFAKQDMLMQDVVKEMIDKKISSVLVEDEKNNIVGIITERDIVRKFTLLEMEDKLQRTVSTVMTRPVEFVQVKDVHKQIVKLHLEKRIRHFPVLSAKEPKKENLVGIVSITDVARNYMLAEQQNASWGIKSPVTQTDAVKHVVGVMASQRSLVNTYLDIFRGLRFNAEEVSDIHKFASSSDVANNALILDLDGFPDPHVHQILPIVVKAKFFLVLTTSRPALIPVFKRYMNQKHQEIAMKPLDISYLSWLLHKRWDANPA